MRKAFLWWNRVKRPLIRGVSFKSSTDYQDHVIVDVEEEGTRMEEVDSLPVGDLNLDTNVCALFAAIQLQDVSEVEEIIDESEGKCDCVNGTYEGLTPLHVACHLRNLAILKLLLRRHAKVEAESNEGITPLHTAITDGWNEGVTELLMHGASPHSHSPAAADRHYDTPLEAAIKIGNHEAIKLIFQHYPDINVMDSEVGSILHLATQSHQPNVVKYLLSEKMSLEMLDYRNKSGDTVMHVVLQRGRVKDEAPLLDILRMLFDAGLDVNSKNKDGQTPLFLASRKRLPKCCELLMSFGCDLLCKTDRGETVIHGACLGGSATILTQLLKTGRLGHLITAADKDGVQPFNLAVQSYSIDCCEILLKNGDSLTYRDTNDATRCSLLLRYFPSTSPQLLTRLFNSYITLSDDPQYDRRFHVIFDYSGILFKNKNNGQSSILEDINHYKKDLLQHPLLESFVDLKWKKVKCPFYTILLSFFVFIIIHTIYIIGINSNCSSITMHISNLWTFKVLHIVMYILIVWPEVITLIANPLTYLRHWETLTKIISLGASAYVVAFHQSTDITVDPAAYDNSTLSLNNDTTQCAPTHYHLDRKISAISVFFGWMELMMLCGRLPILGSHVLMFARIAKSAIRFIAAFLGLLVGFSVSFMVLFGDKKGFESLGKSFVKTLMMMIGEVDYTELVDEKTAVISYLILVVFLFLVCILMANLLIGLAVDDISSLQRMGNIERRSKQVTHIVTFEKMVIVAKRFKLLPRKLVIGLMKLHKVRLNRRIYMNKSRRRLFFYQENYIPRDILTNALSITLSGHTQTDDSTVHAHKGTDDSQMLLQKLEELRKMIVDNMENGSPMDRSNKARKTDRNTT